MKKAACIVPVLLLLALPHVAMAAGPVETARDGEIFPSVKEAMMATSIHKQQPILVSPLTSVAGIRLHRFEGTSTGEVDYALIPVGAPFSRGNQRPQINDKVYTNYGWGNTRCRVYLYRDNWFGVLLQQTDLDWNNMGLPGLNDRVSSIKTTCRGAWFFAGKNFNAGLYYLYIPAYTNAGTLTSVMNNHISSFFHDLD